VIVEAPRIQRSNEVDKQADPINPSNPINSMNQPKAEAKVEKNPINPSNPTNPSNQVKVEAKVEVKKNQIDQKDQVKVETKVKENPTNPINPKSSNSPINLTTQTKTEVKAQKNSINPTDSINPTNRQEVKAEVKNNQTNKISRTEAKAKVEVKENQTHQINRTEIKPKVAVKENSSNSINSINPSNPSNPRNTTNPLIAKDEEVRKFFANYVGRYNRKDLIGFMSFFSNRAIQNQKEGLEGIKKIYFTFFNQSLELKYRLTDLKIEFYQNAINVKAQYELDQLSKNGRRNAFRGSIQWVLAREGEGLKIVSLDYQQTKGESHEI
jgi:ketosteroid isomerase-like protein